MSDLVRDAHQEFWRPPLAQAAPIAPLAEVCRRCATEFMVGAAFCHICGSGRHRTSEAAESNWTRHLGSLRAIDFGRVKGWLGLPLPSLCAFLVGVGCLLAALGIGLVSVQDVSDFQAVQLWRIQWLMAACAAFLVGILFKNNQRTDS